MKYHSIILGCCSRCFFRVIVNENYASDKLHKSPVKDQYKVDIKPKQEPLKASNKPNNVNINSASEKNNVEKELIGKSRPIEINDNKFIDNIAKNIQAHGKNKWKNSNSNDLNRKPQHIIFKSSSSSSSSESSTSESSASSEDEKQYESHKVNNNKNQSNLKTNKQNNSHLKSKMEQLNMVSYNRSYFVNVGIHFSYSLSAFFPAFKFQLFFCMNQG